MARRGTEYYQIDNTKADSNPILPLNVFSIRASEENRNQMSACKNTAEIGKKRGPREGVPLLFWNCNDRTQSADGMGVCMMCMYDGRNIEIRAERQASRKKTLIEFRIV